MTNEASSTLARIFTARWRRIAILSAVALALYALAGFALAPFLLARELVSIAQSQLGRRLEIGQIAVNPFALSVDVRKLRLHDADGSDLLRVEELYVNFEASSLVRRAFTFGEIGIRGPWLAVARDASGDINLSKLVPPPDPKAPPPAAGAALPRLLVQRFHLDDGALDFDDHYAAAPFHTHAGPFALDVSEISTLPDSTGEQAVKISLESGIQIAWTGSLALAPALRAEGEIHVSGPLIAVAHRYLRGQLRFDEAEGAVDLSGRYRVARSPNAGFELGVSDLALKISNLALSAKSSPNFLGWKELAVTGVKARWPEAEAEVAAVRLDGLHVAARREASGAIDLAELLAPRAQPAATTASVAAPAQPAAAPGPAWKIHVAELALRNASAAFTDATLTPPAPLSIASLDVTLRGLRSEPGAKFGLESVARLGGGGVLRVKGDVGVLPSPSVAAEVAADGVALAQIQPYLSQLARVAIRGGALGLDGTLRSDDSEQAAFDGAVRVLDLDTRDLARNESLLAWSELGLDDVQLRLTGRSAQVARVRLVKPFARIDVARDKSTNLGALLVEPPPAAAPAPKNPAPALAPASAKPFRVRVGTVLVRAGETDYKDASLPLPFAARVRDLTGEITTIDTGSAAASRVTLEGRVDPYGLARVAGRLRTSAPTELADISVTFRNVEMPDLSPYAVEFAGRKIARGKISLDLRYQLDKRHLVGQNKLVIDELELGEKVPSPNATDLPLGLAIALLKDANGRIDIDMPVTGSLDDPSFRIGPVIWKAFVTLITKLATAPFRLLGSLLGIESEDFGKLEFEAGRADVLPPDREKLAHVAEALAKRPNLRVEIPAVADPKADAEVMRRQRVEALVAESLGANPKAAAGRDLDKRTRRVVEALYATQFPERALDAQRARFTASPPDDPKAAPKLDELAYLDDLRTQLAAAQAIASEDLVALATARAEAVAAVLRESGGLAPERISTGERRDVEAREGEWVGVELGVGN